jgi:SynChlorMet cassette protein ScmC
MKTESSLHTSPSQRKNGYCLRLGNGQGWHVIADKDSRTWVEKFTSVLGLSSCKPNRYPKIIFTLINLEENILKKTIEKINLDLGIRLPENGWKAKKLQLIRIWTSSDTSDVICGVTPQSSYKYDISMIWQALFPIYIRALESGGIPIHSALVERNGKAFLLAGQGGAGKSTCSRRLPSPWSSLCDDEAFIIRNDKNQYLAHPIPTWSDQLNDNLPEKSCHVEQSYPLKAIFFLKQAQTDEIKTIGQGEASVLLSELASESLTWGWRYMPPDEETLLKKNLFDNSCKLARTVPVFTLRVSPSGRFWKEIEKIFP